MELRTAPIYLDGIKVGSNQFSGTMEDCNLFKWYQGRLQSIERLQGAQIYLKNIIDVSNLYKGIMSVSNLFK